MLRPICMATRSTHRLPAFCRIWGPLGIQSACKGLHSLVGAKYIPTKPPGFVAARNLRTESSKLSLDPRTTSVLLPHTCPGCGAFTQDLRPDQAGFFSVGRKQVKQYLERTAFGPSTPKDPETEIFNKVSLHLANDLQKTFQNAGAQQHQFQLHDSVETARKRDKATPICDRCHDLIHHGTGTPITDMTIHSVKAMISESPYKRNHIYHVLDAADFPLSLVPTLHNRLSLAPQRSKNRRATTEVYMQGRKADLSFIITRADLLAPRKEQVDHLMPYLVQVLRDAIGGSADHVRLGNVHCVSSKRGWWTVGIKDQIWDRGGAGWMVGKANVGKSTLFESVFPKGRSSGTGPLKPNPRSALPTEAEDLEDHIEDDSETTTEQITDSSSARPTTDGSDVLRDFGDALLPPVPKEQNYPTLPIASSLPGTTAAPLRHLFGNGKGELIDLPGLPRGDLHDLVLPEYQKDLVMSSRITPKQITIKPRQSLLVGGLFRIDSLHPSAVLLAYTFAPLPTYVMDTEMAKQTSAETKISSRVDIAKTEVKDRMKSAGSFPLKWDVTKTRTGSLTRKDAGGLSANRLPFMVLSTDVLIEGCGWIELVAQVRKRELEGDDQESPWFDTRPYPMIEIFSPNGGHIGVRRPMEAWSLCDKTLGGTVRKPSTRRSSVKTAKRRRF